MRFHALVAALLASVATGCTIFPLYYDVKPGSVAPRCTDGVCIEVVFFGSTDEVVGLWLDAPPGTQLINAHLLPDATPPCQGHMPVEWVTIDRRTVRKGPLDVGGKHGLALGFPMDGWFPYFYGADEMFVDLELSTAGHPRCVRARLTDVDGRVAVGQ
jgi:hypothetical protein